MYSLLEDAVADFQEHGGAWHDLIESAEKQGVAPLLFKHLTGAGNRINIPAAHKRTLQSLYLRNRRSNSIRNRVVSGIADHCDQLGIDLLLVKGIALCSCAYSDPGIRPMRDIDLLVRKSDLTATRELLQHLGWQTEEGHDIPDDYYHLPPMVKTVDGLPITIELHHNLLPPDQGSPLWPLEKSFHRALEFTVNDTVLRTLSLEETLWYVYLHGFQPPLTYEPFRLMHVADMVTLVERYLGSIDWQRVDRESPILVNVLSRFHYLTPWSEAVMNSLWSELGKAPSATGIPYQGWPAKKNGESDSVEYFRLLRETLWPGQWWVQVYYGYIGGMNYWKVRFFIHPRTVWRWIKTYSQGGA